MATLRSHARNLVYRHIGGTALVLIYHRVANLERDPQALAVSPVNFEGQMATLSERFYPIPLAELAAGLEARRVPDGAVAVTFDDGYADNLLAAAPVLTAHAIPATMYVSSGFVDDAREYWWDEIEQLVLEPGTLPAHLELSAADSAVFRFDLGDFATYSSEQAAADAGWNILGRPAGPRQRLCLELGRFLRPLTAPEQARVLRQLWGMTGRTPESRRTTPHLTIDQLRELDRTEGICLGGHTSTHGVLSARTLAEQRAEILEDREALTDMCGHPIDSFSYPYGGLDDYTEETVALVREAGYTHAVSNHIGVVKPWSDRYRLPRNVVLDWDAETFAAKLEGWFDEPC